MLSVLLFAAPAPVYCPCSCLCYHPNQWLKASQKAFSI
jgi:hypothetical protein